jgi:hypothetical protein
MGGWRFPYRFDWKLPRQREAAGLRANGVALAAALWAGDAYPAPGATLGIGMTMGYIAGRHAAASLE